LQRHVVWSIFNEFKGFNEVRPCGKPGISGLIEKVKDDVAELLEPSTQYLVKKRLRPVLLTMLGLMLNIVAAVLFGIGYLRWGGGVVLLAGVFDFFDGQVARAGRSATAFGALLDSTVDRYSEIFVWFGLAVYFIRDDSLLTSSAIFFALAGSLMVSYVRARAEGLGEECKVGFMQRPERVIAIGVGALVGEIGTLGPVGITIAVWAIAVLANFTALHRVLHFRKGSAP
jgi:CDP-diacylglycerol--glycerol-3-phosphate 3-phosphatidyltransferase